MNTRNDDMREKAIREGRVRYRKTERDHKNGYPSRAATNKTRRAEYTRTSTGAAQPRYRINDAPSHGKGNSSKAFKLKPAKAAKKAK